MKTIIAATLLTLLSLSAQAWELQNPEQLETAIRAAFPQLPQGDLCSSYLTIETLSCTVNSDQVNCSAQLTSTAGEAPLTTQDKKLVEALQLADVNFTKIVEVYGVSCSRTRHNDDQCRSNLAKTTCHVRSYGGN